MRCVTPLLLRQEAIRPPSGAGFGENDWAPFSPTIVIEAVLLAPGAVGLALEAEPDLPPQAVKTTTAPKTQFPTTETDRIRPSFMAVIR
jgi:hypothetical protein